jgi:hypothetical protein
MPSYTISIFQVIPSTLPFRPFQLYGYHILRIWAAQQYGIALPPGHAPSELEGLQVGKNLVVEKSAKP